MTDNWEPELNDIVETEYTACQGIIEEMRIMDNGLQVFKVSHLDGFQNWYTKDQLTKVGKYKEKYKSKR